MDGHCEPTASGSELRVTLGLVTLNEENTIPSSLGALLDEMERLDNDCELIVVAGGQDGTIRIVESMLSGESRAKMVVDTEPKGKPAALNRIFSLSQGDVVVLSDGDVTIGRGSVESLLREFDDPEVGCASGRVLAADDEDNLIVGASSLINDLMHLSRSELSRSQDSLDLASGYLLAVRRDLVNELPIGLKSDDGYISLLILSKGYKIAYAEDAVVFIKFPKNASDFIRQKMRTRYGHMELKGYFGAASGRTAFREIRDFVKYLRPARRHGSHGPEAVVIAILLLAVCWIDAYVRRIAPSFLFRTPIWKPIKSTK